MSLLADLLSKVKHQGFKRDVPPNLKQVVFDSSERAATHRKIIFLSIFTALAVSAGFGAIYIMEFIKPSILQKGLQPERFITEQQKSPSALPRVEQATAP